MSLHLSASAYQRQPRDTYFTPPWAAQILSRYVIEHGLMMPGMRMWEPAAGAGHIAGILADMGEEICLATDISPAPVEEQVYPVESGDFLAMTGGGTVPHPWGIVTNPPYGHRSEMSIAFLNHGLDIITERRGFMALLLPFEFDSRSSRQRLVGGHPYFASKLTVPRIRWVNLLQKKSGPMGHHAWFIWHTEQAVRERIWRSNAFMKAA